MKATILLTILISLSLPASYAGDKGNGGDAVVCENGRVMLLDKHEALKRKREIYIPGETLTQKVDKLFERLGVFDPLNIKEIKKIGTLLVNDLQKYENGIDDLQYVLMSTDVLHDIDDSSETAIPLGCVMEQLVVNKSYVLPGDFKFEIRSDLWQRLDLEDKAMTITHESLYQWFSKDSDSRRARYINGLIATNLDPNDWFKYARTMNKGEKIGIPTFIDFTDFDIKNRDLLFTYSDLVGENTIGLSAVYVTARLCFGEQCGGAYISSVKMNSGRIFFYVSIGNFIEKIKRGKKLQGFQKFTNGGITFNKNFVYDTFAKILMSKTGQVIQLTYSSGCAIESFEYNGNTYDFDCDNGHNRLILNINGQNEITSFEIEKR